MLAEIVRLDRDHHRQVAGDTDLVDAVKLVARAQSHRPTREIASWISMF